MFFDFLNFKVVAKELEVQYFKRMNQELPDLYSYTDYRDYIRDYYLHRKSYQKSFSLNLLAKQLGVTKMAVKFVIDKKRHLAYDMINPYAKALKLNKKEEKYFDRLVYFAKARTEDEKDALFDKLMRMRDGLGERDIANTEAPLLQNWYYPVIAEMSYLKDFQCDVEWIQERLAVKVAKKDIAQAICYLEKNQLLKGQNAKMLKVPSNFQSILYKKYNRQKLDLGKWAIDELEREDKETFTMTISVSKERMETAQRMVREFRHELHSVLASTDPADEVIEVNMQLFSVTKSDKNINISGREQ